MRIFQSKIAHGWLSTLTETFSHLYIFLLTYSMFVDKRANELIV